MKKNTGKFLFLFSFIALTFIGCGKDIIDALTPLKPGEMRVTVSTFGVFDATNAHVIDGGIDPKYSLKASVKTADGLNDSVVIDIVIPKKAVTPYTVDFTDATSLMNYCITHEDGSCTNYRVQSGKGTGTLTVKSVTDNDNIQGTFSGTFESISSSGTITVSGGEFYATF
jgi:hypothetical protein